MVPRGHPQGRVLVRMCRARLICILASSLGVLRAAPAHAGPALDPATSATGSTASLSWSHTVGTGMKRLLIVGVSLRGSQSVSGVTYGGIVLSNAVDVLGAGNQNRASMWYLVAPASGTATVTVTLAGSAAVIGGAVSLSGVDQTAPLGTAVSANGTSASPSVTVSSATTQLVIDTMATNGDGGPQSAAGGQTEEWNTGTGTSGGDARGGGSTQPGAASVTMSWTLNASKSWALCAVPVHGARRVVVIGSRRRATPRRTAGRGDRPGFEARAESAQGQVKTLQVRAQLTNPTSHCAIRSASPMFT
jgi:hypothetical protein